MADVLAELHEVLRSNSKEKLTEQEERVFQIFKARSLRALTFGACGSSALTWIATRRLTHGLRLNFSIGSAMVAGMWRLNRSLSGCLEEILEWEGTRIQWEAANIILKKHPNDASRMQLVRKHYFPDQVFDDRDPDRPYLRWRARGFVVDSTSFPRAGEAGDSGSHEEPDDVQPKKPTVRGRVREMAVKRDPPVAEMVADPLDCIFGDQETSQEIPHSDKASMLHSRRRLRAHKRAHRRHRAHDADTSD